MKLSFEEIRSITVGAIDVRKTESGIGFFKCTDAQIAAWYKWNKDLGYRAETTTGVRLDFYTTSKSFAFKTTRGAKFEVLIDGMQRERFVLGEGESAIEKKIELCDALGHNKDRHRVTLVFPSHSVGMLEYVELDDGAYFERAEYKHKLLFIGDSITQGHNSKFDTLSYAWRVTSYFDAESVINGIGGAFFDPATFEKINFDPDAVIIAYGTNDARRFSYAEMEEKTKGFLALIKEAYADKKIIVISPIWRADNNGNVMGEDFESKRAMVEREAIALGFNVVSGLKLVPPISDFFADTYLHPNDLGFGLYAQNLIKEISGIIN